MITSTYLDRAAERILRDRVLPILRRELGEALVSSPFESPYATERGDRGSTAVIGVDRDAQSLDVSVEIPASLGYGECVEGTELPGWGFGLTCTRYGGGIGPGGMIFNYTTRVWTRDREEIRERLQALAAQAEDWAYECVEFYHDN